MSLAEYNENMQEYVGKHIRAVWGHRHSYNRYIQRMSSLEKLRRNTLFQIEVQKDVENNSDEEDEVMKLEVAFNGPLLPSDKSIVTMRKKFIISLNCIGHGIDMVISNDVNT